MYLLVVSNKLNNFAKKKKDKSNKVKGTAQLVAGGLVGQQAVRSGVPRALGVRLESHSTSRKNAREILKNGGILDPNKSGTGAIRALENNQGLGDVTDINKAKGKVYITGLHKDAKDRVIKSSNIFTPSTTLKADEGNALLNVIARKNQRNAYRASSGINWDKVNSAGEKAYNEIMDKNTKAKLGKKFVKERAESARLLAGGQERIKQTLKNTVLPTGKSLYVGGSDEYFNKNFLPDFDDPKAMYSTNKVKVSGNRLSATLEALKREGNGNRLKGASKLIKANKGRVGAGLAIAGLGGLAASKLVTSGINNIRGKRDERDDKGKKRGKYK
jgi:hypothetical protein